MRCIKLLPFTHRFTSWRVCKSMVDENSGNIMILQYRICPRCGYRQFARVDLPCN